ncbi:hypothetical protein, partial [Streptomyces sp. NPDC047024]|uniref:hypothetical protein n=1 Tax=Streptomyces sp. NPDC047024 TaxID=3155476 RepID=UPI0033CC2865
MAAQMLLHSLFLPDLWPLLHKRLNNDRLAQAFIVGFGQEPVYCTLSHQLSGLTEEALAGLYLC